MENKETSSFLRKLSRDPSFMSQRRFFTRCLVEEKKKVLPSPLTDVYLRTHTHTQESLLSRPFPARLEQSTEKRPTCYYLGIRP